MCGFKDQLDDVCVIDLRNVYVLFGLIDSYVYLFSEFLLILCVCIFSILEVDIVFEGVVNVCKMLFVGFIMVQDVGGLNEVIFLFCDVINVGKLLGLCICVLGWVIMLFGGYGDVNGYLLVFICVFIGLNICNGVDDCC